MKIIDFAAVNEVNEPIDDMIFQAIFASWLEKEMATCSGVLALEIPWIEECGGLQSMGLLSVGHD